MNTVIDNIPQTEIRPSAIHGLGLFALTDLEKGVALSVLDGQRVPWALFTQMADQAGAPFIEWNALTPELLLVRYFRTKYSYINHARHANCAVRQLAGVLMVQTLSDISQGDELTLDYRAEPLPPEYLAGHGATYL